MHTRTRMSRPCTCCCAGQWLVVRCGPGVCHITTNRPPAHELGLHSRDAVRTAHHRPPCPPSFRTNPVQLYVCLFIHRFATRLCSPEPAVPFIVNTSSLVPADQSRLPPWPLPAVARCRLQRGLLGHPLHVGRRPDAPCPGRGGEPSYTVAGRGVGGGSCPVAGSAGGRSTSRVCEHGQDIRLPSDLSPPLPSPPPTPNNVRAHAGAGPGRPDPALHARRHGHGLDGHQCAPLHQSRGAWRGVAWHVGAWSRVVAGSSSVSVHGRTIWSEPSVDAAVFPY